MTGKQLVTFNSVLSKFTTLYPNRFLEGAPSDYCDESMSKEAVDAAEAILQWCVCFQGRKVFYVFEVCY